MTYIISSVQSDSNEEVFVFEKDGKKIPLNSLYSPEKEAQRFLQKISSLEKHFIIIIGYGNGKVFEQLLNSNVYKANTYILFIEPYVEVKRSDAQQGAFNSNSEKVSFVYYQDLNPTIFSRYLSALIGIPVSIHVHPNYLKTEETAIKKCLRIIDEGTQTQQILNNTEVRFAVDWIVEPLLNIDSIAKSLNIVNLKGKFKGERAALIASGPSLKVHMDFLEKNKDLFHLFSAGSALKALLANGIEPDYVLSLDSSDVNYDAHFKDIDYNGTLIFETLSNSNIQKEHTGPLIVCKNNLDHISTQNFNNLLSFNQSSPSVAIFALQVIEYLGFSEVFLIGQDLALVNGDYYAADVTHHEGMKDVSSEMTVVNNIGEQVGTTRSLKIFLDIFEVVIKNISEEIEVFNLSKYGAEIKGTKFIDELDIPLQEFSKKNIEIKEEVTIDFVDQDTVIKEFLAKITAIRSDVLEAKKGLMKLYKKSLVTTNDMQKVVMGFRKVAQHTILEEVLLSNLTFVFNKIVNSFNSFDLKQNYTSKDHLLLVEELENFYIVLIEYTSKLVEDKRLVSYK